MFDYPTLERLVEHLLEPIVRRASSAPPPSRSATPAPGRERHDESPDQPLEQAIARELAELESLLAGSSDE